MQSLWKRQAQNDVTVLFLVTASGMAATNRGERDEDEGIVGGKRQNGRDVLRHSTRKM